MDKQLQIKLLATFKKSRKTFELTVTGFSMNPVLYDGDTVTITSDDNYKIGDILVFVFNQNELLIHRLMEIKNEIYFCKGDNALRMEKISGEQIFGKVIGIRRNSEEVPLDPFTSKLIILSKAVNNVFFKCRYDPVKTKNTYIYKVYNKIFLEGEDIKMYVKNEKMDFIETDETSVAIFDPESGDTHFLDESGVDILKTLEQPHDFDKLGEKICEIYDGEREEILTDLKEFLKDAVDKGFVIEL